MPAVAKRPGSRAVDEVVPSSVQTGAPVSWYHKHWTVDAEWLATQEGLELKGDTLQDLKLLKEGKAQMTCNHCHCKKSFNPSTNFKTHLMQACLPFKSSPAFESEEVQRERALIASKEKVRNTTSALCACIACCSSHSLGPSVRFSAAGDAEPISPGERDTTCNAVAACFSYELGHCFRACPRLRSAESRCGPLLF